jgi:hypothetical protein
VAHFEILFELLHGGSQEYDGNPHNQENPLRDTKQECTHSNATLSRRLLPSIASICSGIISYAGIGVPCSDLGPVFSSPSRERRRRQFLPHTSQFIIHSPLSYSTLYNLRS